MNELINDEAVYRTAPATPDLLIIGRSGEYVRIIIRKIPASTAFPPRPCEVLPI